LHQPAEFRAIRQRGRRFSDAYFSLSVLANHETHPRLGNACKQRQDDFGQRYYGALGIDRNDATARSQQTGRNFLFFDAPVGLIFTIDARLQKHSWLDCGLFIQNIMIAARARGLDTCPQVLFARYPQVDCRAPEVAVRSRRAVWHVAWFRR